MKKFLLAGLISLFGLISFGFCDTVEDLIQVIYSAENYEINNNWTVLYQLNSSSEYGVYCLNAHYVSGPTYFNFGYAGDYTYGSAHPGDYMTVYMIGGEGLVCFYVNTPYIRVQSYSSSLNPTYIDYELFRVDELLAENLPVMSIEQCQQEYSLMPIDSCNSEYCEMNNLCEVIGGSGSSTLYINDIWHESAPFIYVNIPEEIQRNYNTGINEFTINVEGLNGDQDYINGIIDVNSYRPTSEDFTQTFVGGLTLIFPYIIITAVILFIWRFIRKIFK